MAVHQLLLQYRDLLAVDDMAETADGVRAARCPDDGSSAEEVLASLRSSREDAAPTGPER
jgi:hypothetical protein